MEAPLASIHAGVCLQCFSKRRLHRLCGFTLIEMLVVVMVMGLLIGLVSVNLRPDERGLLNVEAERLAQLLTLAAEESRLTGKTIRWMANGAGYRFWRLRSDGEWSEIRDNDLLRARSLPQGMAISGLRVETTRAQGLMRLEFPPHGSPIMFAIQMSLGDQRIAVVSSPVGDVQVQPQDAGGGDAKSAFH